MKSARNISAERRVVKKLAGVVKKLAVPCEDEEKTMRRIENGGSLVPFLSYVEIYTPLSPIMCLTYYA